MRRKKQKRKLKHRRKRKVSLRNQFDRHHILFIGAEWRRGYLGLLRRYPYCVITLHKNSIHRYIHTHMLRVPVPRESTAKDVIMHLSLLEQYGAITQEDAIEKRLLVLIALFDCAEQPTADALREQLRIVHEFKKSPSK